MRATRFLKMKTAAAFFLILVLCAGSGCFMMGYAKIPSQIKLIEGMEKELNLGVLAAGSFESSGASLKVNDKPVSGNITIDLNHLNKLKSDTPGSATMTISVFGFPLRKVPVDILPNTELVPCGTAVGVTVSTAGIMVLGTGVVDGADGANHKPSEGILRSGDLILKANDESLKTKEQLGDIIKESDDAIDFEIARADEIIKATVSPVKNKGDAENKIGVWVRDGTQGIGTVTYYNPETNRFAALGHGIMDVDTKQMMHIQNGDIKKSDIQSVVKGKKGVPGELIGTFGSDGNIIGRVEANSPYGIFGSVDKKKMASLPKERLPIGLSDTVHTGPAQIKTTVDGDATKTYDIYIESVNKTGGDETKGMVIRITDPDLLSRTGGIVQGMSGSPIIQDGKLIGAVTHVFVQDPAKGYGIFIQNMLKYELSL